jgi:hypothetical protein
VGMVSVSLDADGAEDKGWGGRETGGKGKGSEGGGGTCVSCSCTLKETMGVLTPRRDRGTGW